MRILFVTPWYPARDSVYSGAFVREHARAVRGLGHDVAVLHLTGAAGRAGGLWKLELETDDQLTDGIPTYRLRSRRLPLGLSLPVGLWASLRAYRRLRGSAFEPDVIHAHVFTAGLPAVVVGRVYGVPVVLSEHSTDFIEGTLSRWSVRKARFTFPRAARVLPVSKCLQSAIESLGIVARFRIVPNAIDTSVFAPPAAPRPAAGFGRLLFVGHLEPRKGVPTLIEAARLLSSRTRDWHLDLVGGGAVAEYAAMAERAGLADLLTFMGPQPRSEVARLMRESDVFVLPSHFETQGVVLLEAMASGMAIVSTTAGAIPEVVGPEDGVLVEAGDAPGLAIALAEVLAQRGRFDGLEIARRAAARYGLAVVGRQLVEVYEEAVAGRRQAVSSAGRG